VDRGFNDLAYLFRTLQKPRPVFLLGAGASFRSGVPLSDAAVRRIAQKHCARSRFGKDDVPILPSDFMPHLQSQPWFIRDPDKFAENFPLAVENFLNPSEFRREFFEEMIRTPTGPSDGYRSLARMMGKLLIGTVLTTNFDSLIGEALREQVPKPPRIIELRTADDLVMFGLLHNYQIVYLHGSVEHYQDKNLTAETQQLDQKLVTKIRPLLHDSPLVVIGYRGAEPSITHHLLGSSTVDDLHFRNGLYWCLRKGDSLHPNVISLRDRLKSNFQLVEIDGFDELLTSLDKELEGESWYSGTIGRSVTLAPGPVAKARFDLEPLPDRTTKDLNHELILSTLSEYVKRFNWPEITQQNYLTFLEGIGFLQRVNDTLVPSRGCFLLFGIDVQKKFPYAVVTLLKGTKSQDVIDGNLITQRRKLLDILEQLNTRVRLKTEKSAEVQQAYPARALTELTVNLLVHRDYEAHSYSQITFRSGHSIVFENPGGLMPTVKDHVHADSQGRFEPIRGLTEMRNPLLADIFYGIGSMDKQGSGLADVKRFAIENGGSMECSIGDLNQSVRISLLQPLQDAPEGSPLPVATRITKSELFVTNLLPFKVLPNSVFSMPLRGQFTNSPIFDPDDRTLPAPIVISHGGFLLGFSDFLEYPEFSGRKGFPNRLVTRSRQEMLQQPDTRRLFVWLLNKHWEFYLRSKKLLTVESKRKRAFLRLAGTDRTSVSYVSKMNRRVSRDVVKKRGEEPNIYFENEAIHYAIEEFYGEWALQLRPTYVFTKSDGLTPLNPLLQTRRATRRFKFDRNPAVENDLVFWSRFLSDGQPTISLDKKGSSEIVLDSEYVSVEVPTIENEAGA